jgi:hypothetical protein
MSRAQQFNFTFSTPDDNSIALAQQLGEAGNLTLAGAEVTAGVWTATDGLAHQIGVACAGDINTVVFTITGTDREGRVLTDTVTGVNGDTVETTKYFYTISQIAASAAVGTDVIVGTVDEVISKVFVTDYRGVDQYTIAVDIGGTLNYDIEYTFQDIHNTSSTQSVTWVNHSEIVNETTSQDSYVEAMPIAFRLAVNSYSSGATAKVSYIPNMS